MTYDLPHLRDHPRRLGEGQPFYRGQDTSLEYRGDVDLPLSCKQAHTVHSLREPRRETNGCGKCCVCG
jgi:hypothetical protein